MVLPLMLNVPSWSSSASVMILSKYMLKRLGESKLSCLTSVVVLKQSQHAVFEVDCNCGFVLEMFDDSCQVGVDDTQPHRSPQCCMSYPV
ncbi:hypothetical protein DPMN_149085 [Dreissena polymorpha]|uniref:Uncharacterized protein n=1 Tax=Dreissena polymorpha TaxID=45954 RepID=A0A9D4J251_DREPO|nr:hypothetical protein DPMN_149085 [Dreissena polymorpha]